MSSMMSPASMMQRTGYPISAASPAAASYWMQQQPYSMPLHTQVRQPERQPKYQTTTCNSSCIGEGQGRFHSNGIVIAYILHVEIFCIVIFYQNL